MPITRCVATPSRIVVFFDDDPVEADNEESWDVGIAGETQRRGVGSAEFDAARRLAVLANPYPERGPGAWLYISFARGPGFGADEFYVRVDSDLAVLGKEVGDAFPDLAKSDQERDTTSDAEAEDSADGRTKRDPVQRAEFSSPPAVPRSAKPRLAEIITPGLVVVGVGLLVLFGLGVIALVEAPEDDMNTIAAAAFGVIGSVVGAFFGVHAGLGDRRRVDESIDAKDRTTQVLAGMMPPDEYKQALQMLDRTEQRGGDG